MLMSWITKLSARGLSTGQASFAPDFLPFLCISVLTQPLKRRQ